MSAENAISYSISFPTASARWSQSPPRPKVSGAGLTRGAARRRGAPTYSGQCDTCDREAYRDYVYTQGISVSIGAGKRQECKSAPHARQAPSTDLSGPGGATCDCREPTSSRPNTKISGNIAAIIAAIQSGRVIHHSGGTREHPEPEAIG